MSPFPITSRALNETLASTSLDDLKSYMIWHYVSSKRPLLSKPFVDENFDFYSRYLTGAQELQPRWKRCVQSRIADWAKRWARSTSRRLSRAIKGEDAATGRHH